MATYLSPQAAATYPAKSLRVGLVQVEATYSFSTSISTAMVVQMIKIPKGARTGFIMVANTNAGQATVQVGDGIDPDRYYVETTLSAGMGMVVCNAVTVPGYTYSLDDTIDVTISRVTITTLGGALYLKAIFTMDP